MASAEGKALPVAPRVAGWHDPAMRATPRRRLWRGPPLALQILALLIGGLFVAQLVTLLLTLLLPPAPAPQYGLDDIAAALRGGPRGGAAEGSLERLVQSGPPDLAGPGWLVSERSRGDLAGLLGRDVADVRLAFYTPLPFAGTAAAPTITLKADDGPLRPLSALRQPLGRGLILVQAPGGPPPGPPPQSVPSLDPSRGPPPRDTLPPGGLPGTAFPGGGPAGGGLRPPPLRGGIEIGPAAGGPATRPGALYAIDPGPGARGQGGIFIPGDGGAAVPPILQGGAPPSAGQLPGGGGFAGPPGGPGGAPPGPGAAGGFAPAPLSILPDGSPSAPARNAPPLVSQAAATPTPRAASVPPAEPRTAPAIAPPAPPAPVQALPSEAEDAPAAPPAERADVPSGPPIAVTRAGRGLFGLAPAPFVEGDFVAALRLADGRWSVVQPVPAPFPNSWQRRVLLWFALALAIVAPLGWLFARRLVKPLGAFGAAAERLGRDPAAAVIALEGPAEIGRAAHAFNLMQTRLRSFVDDRTAMIGAISHDLRTPLTRMRFRIEDVPDEVREGLLEEVEEMEAMISSVLDFIRDASAPGVRERLDLRTLIDDVVEDAVMIGADVTVEQAAAATVDVDVLGMRRVLDNLLENAFKYGRRARVRLTTDEASAVAEILDDGPGLPEHELERVFEPFYRSEAARSSDKAGHGLGLAVCRSIARAHGGDVRLRRSGEGFLAEVRLPLAFGA